MEIEASLPPIEVRLNSEVRQYAFRLAKLSANHPVNLLKATTSDQDNPNSPNRLDWPKRPKPSTIQRIRQSIQGLVSPSALEPLIHFYFPPWAKDLPYKVNVSSLTKEEEAISHNRAILLAYKTKSTIVYTDASSSAESTGIGVGLVAYSLIEGNQKVVTQSLRNLGDEQLVYNGELEGTTLGIEYISRIARQGWQYIVFSDNQAGLYRLKTPSDNPGQRCQIRAILASNLILEKGASIALQWVPGHTDVEGNEKADELAKQASKRASDSQETSWAMYGLRVKELKSIEWAKAIELADRKKGLRKRSYKLASKLKVPQGTKRLIASTYYQLRLGHGYLKAYLKRIGKTNNDKCSCGAKETTDHILFQCINLVEERKALLKDLPINSPSKAFFFNTTKGIERVLSFIEETSIGTRKWHLQRVERELEEEELGERELVELSEEEGGVDDV
jgi:ribonuclease HI